MKDIFELPIFEFAELVKKYTDAVKENDTMELNLLIHKYPGLLTKDFGECILQWLNAFGITKEVLRKIRDGDPDFLDMGETEKKHLH